MLHVALQYIEPLIWRRVRVPENYTLHQLHRVLQLIFSWLDYHLYSFDISNRRFERPDRESEAEDATAFTLADLSLRVGRRFIYTYDFGDDWRHMIKVESFVPMPAAHEYDWSPRLMGGARAAPPEDVGGPPGYGMLLKWDPGAAEVLGALPEGFAPERFDQRTLDQALALVAGWGAI